MRTTFKLGFGLLLASALLGSGCGSDRKRGAAPADPLATVTGFCEEWGKRACSAPVVEVCLATDAAACANQQAQYCVLRMPPNYASDNAQTCLDAVGAAYSDARLTAKEYDTVINRGPPCDKLIEGPGQSGSPCSETSDCNTLDNLVCVSKPGAEGTCQVPVVQGGGRTCVEAFHLCEPGFYCNGSNCIEGPGEGQPCSPQVPCGEDFTCTAPEGSAICVAKKPNTAACSSDEECVSKICSRSASSGVCAPEIRLAAADPLCENLRQQ
jgi:hypothetical protein